MPPQNRYSEAALIYRHHAKELTPEQRTKIKELLRNPDQAHIAHQWLTGILSDEELTFENPEGTLQPHEFELLQRQLNLLDTTEHLIQDPGSIPASQQAQLLRHLAYQMEQDMPTLVAEPINPGESIVSFSFNGVKELNKNGGGIHVTDLILQQFRREIEVALRKENLVPLSELPTQQLWKRISYRIGAAESTDLAEKIEAIELSVTQQLQQFIDELPDDVLPYEGKELTKSELAISHGIAQAERQRNAFDLLQESVIHSEIQIWEHTVSQNKPELIRGLEQFDSSEELRETLAEETPDEPKQKVEYAFTCAEKIRHVLTRYLHDHSETLLSTTEEETEGFSHEFFQIIRQSDASALRAYIPTLTEEETSTIMTLGKLYTQTLFTPAVLKEFTLDDSTRHIRKTRLLRGSTERIFKLAIQGTVNPETDQDALQEAWDHLQRDHRFTGADLEGPFLNPLFFDRKALSLDSPHYISLDLVGVGAKFLEEAQQLQHHIAGNGNSYETIIQSTKTLGESSWKRINAAFEVIAEVLYHTPALAEFLEQNDGVIPASTKGDEMVIVIPGNIDQHVVVNALREAQLLLQNHDSAAPVRLALASATREDANVSHEKDKIAEHVKTRVLSEKYGIDIAKMFEPFYPGCIAEVRHISTSSGVEFRLHIPQTAGNSDISTDWYTFSRISTFEEKQRLLQDLSMIA